MTIIKPAEMLNCVHCNAKGTIRLRVDGPGFFIPEMRPDGTLALVAFMEYEDDPDGCSPLYWYCDACGDSVDPSQMVAPTQQADLFAALGVSRDLWDCWKCGAKGSIVGNVTVPGWVTLTPPDSPSGWARASNLVPHDDGVCDFNSFQCRECGEDVGERQSNQLGDLIGDEIRW